MKSSPKRSAKYRLAASLMSKREKARGFYSPYHSLNWHIHSVAGFKKMFGVKSK